MWEKEESLWYKFETLVFTKIAKNMYKQGKNGK